MPFHRLALICLFALLVLPGRAAAQQDVKDSADHPLFPSRMPGYYISSYSQVEFGSHRFPARGEKPVVVEGKLTRINYRVQPGVSKPGGLAIRRNYENAIKAVGGEVVGMYRGEMVVLKLAKDGSEVWAEVRASNAASANIYTLTIVERTTMRQVITADAMRAALEKDGFITVDILFETARADIDPQSDPVLDQIVALMTKNPALRLSVEGHTDNVGPRAANLELSAARAAAVVAALVARGVDTARLTPAGFGPDRPVADNRTEEGRAKNRRVELVKR